MKKIFLSIIVLFVSCFQLLAYEKDSSKEIAFFEFFKFGQEDQKNEKSKIDNQNELDIVATEVLNNAKEEASDDNEISYSNEDSTNKEIDNVKNSFFQNGTSVTNKNSDQKIVCCTKNKYYSRIYFGPNYSYVKIKQENNFDFNGNLFGLQTCYDYRQPKHIYGGLSFLWRQGEIKSSDGKDNVVDIDVHERIGYTFCLNTTDRLLILFSGLGFRYLQQDIHLNNFNKIKLIYEDFYLPLGLSVDYKVNQTFKTGLNFVYMPQVYPSLIIHPLEGSRWVLKYSFSNFYVDVPLTFSYKKYCRFELTLNPFFEYWKDGKTTARTNTGLFLGIPENKSFFVGLKLNLAYLF